ncbi:MAG: hypothetical protein IPP90_04435 [Gemmatimonadaceae bacterium]|nr:hypothetical protein [Gemmatimonadaceae bacterium]
MTVANSTHPVTNPKAPTSLASTLVSGRDVKGFQIVARHGRCAGLGCAGPRREEARRGSRIMLDAAEKRPRYLSVSAANKAGHLLLPIGLHAGTDG